MAKKGTPQPARAEGNPEELGVTSPFSCLPLMPFPSPVTFADLSGCLVKRSKQLEEDQPRSAKNLSFVRDTEPFFPLWAWITSRLNPADGPSRRFEKDAQEGNEEKRVRERLSVQQGSRGPAERYTVALQELVLVYRIMLWKWRWSR